MRKRLLSDLVKQALEVDEVEIHFANITTKSPAIGSGISWHRDFPNAYICPETPQMLRTMICIDGMDEENGATLFVSGTHLDNTAASDVSPTDARIVKAVCPPGAVVAIHPLRAARRLAEFLVEVAAEYRDSVGKAR